MSDCGARRRSSKDAWRVMAEREQPEQWTSRPEVLQLFGSMLAHPLGDHTEAVFKILKGALLDAHVASLTHWIDGKQGAAVVKGCKSNKPVALHTIMYHLLGGADGDVPTPPAKVTPEESDRCNPGWATAKPTAKKFFDDMRAARSQEKGGDGGAMLRRLRGRLFAPAAHKNLRPADAAGDAAVEQRAASSKRVAAAPPAPPPAEPADAELQRRTDCCTALAMGTHYRLGLQSRVLWLRGQDDVFRLIAEHAGLRTTEWMARELPKEIPTLRLHLRLEHGGRRLAEQQLDGARITIAAQQKQLERAQRQAESALQNAECTRAQFDEFRRELQDDCAAWKARVEQACRNALKEQRAAAAAAATEMRGEHRAELIALDEAFKALDAQRVAELEEVSSDRRDLIEELRAARDEASANASEFEREAREQMAAATRLRNARNGSALERLAVLEAELRVAKQRRTKNQRRVQTSYLADRRAREAEGRAAEAQARLGEFAIEDEETLQRAARADALEKQARVLVGERASARVPVLCSHPAHLLVHRWPSCRPRSRSRPSSSPSTGRWPSRPRRSSSPTATTQRRST